MKKRWICLAALLGVEASSFAEGEYQWRFFTWVRNTTTGELLAKTVSAEIKIVSRIDENRFKASTRAGAAEEKRPFILNAEHFTADDQAYLKQWNPELAVDLTDYQNEAMYIKVEE